MVSLARRIPIRCAVAAIYLAIALTFPVTLWSLRGFSFAHHWMRYDPGTGVFVTFLLPIIAWFLARNLEAFKTPWQRKHRRALVISLVLFAILALFMIDQVRNDLTRPSAFPCYAFKIIPQGEDPCAADAAVRRAWREWADAKQKGAPASELSLKQSKFRELVDRYESTWRVMDPNTQRVRWSALNVQPRLALIVNYFSFLLVLAFVWHCASFLWSERPPKAISGRAIGILLLMLCWFPLRVFSETYINFFDSRYDMAKNYIAFDGAAVVALLTAVMLMFAYAKEVSLGTLKTVFSVALSLSAVAAVHSADMRDAVVQWLSTDVQESAFWFFTMLILVILVVIAIAGVGELDNDTAKAAPVPRESQAQVRPRGSEQDSPDDSG